MCYLLYMDVFLVSVQIFFVKLQELLCISDMIDFVNVSVLIKFSQKTSVFTLIII